MAIIAIISSDHIYFSYMIFLLQLNRPISDKGRGAHKQDGRMAVVWHRQEEKEEVSKAGNSTTSGCQAKPGHSTSAAWALSIPNLFASIHGH